MRRVSRPTLREQLSEVLQILARGSVEKDVYRIAQYLETGAATLWMRQSRVLLVAPIIPS